MFSWLASLVSSCLSPMRRYARMGNDDTSDDGSSTAERSLFWRRDLGKHSWGEFSFAVIQANEVIEDHSQVEIGSDAIFVGVYDGHGGPEASVFVRDHLFQHLMSIAKDNGTISEETLRGAVSASEDGFMTVVRRSFRIKKVIATVGSCCLIGVIWKGTLYIANVGDSRAVIGSIGGSNRIIAEQLSREHNANIEEIREELRALHPDDPDIVVKSRGAWRVKGIIQVTRSIGDAYLKRPQFALDSSFPRFHLTKNITKAVLTAEPSVMSRNLQPRDRFIIFASDGLWELLTNQEAADIVHNNPRNGIARRLLKTALRKAARRANMTYKQLQKVEKGKRRDYHDDITVIVVFIDHGLLGKKPKVPELSIKGFMASDGQSNFKQIQELM
ncbi:probable protein phosphatase 2C 68 [Abrus precatorius]|uniref:protein-serine/threonine phosphatase n=1 Tax=Abrus precatorius TaxID=3816 RepID=A0A8B8LE83_ABRPR|nr:probable protein phosphatase 2C 68 [Abrus precatorius]